MDCIENALKITGWNRARVKLLARFLTALLVSRSVNLTKVANVFAGEAKTASHYKRLQRFLRGFDLDMAALSHLLLGWLKTHGVQSPYILSMDRTNWKFGHTEINILMIAVVHRQIAFPVVWMLLGKAGNSSAEERKTLLKRYIEAFGKESIAYLTADREFAGKHFLSWLSNEGISFVMRLRGNVGVANAQGEMGWARRLFSSAEVGVVHDLGRRRVFGKTDCLELFVSGIRLADGDDLILVSDRAAPGGSLTHEYAHRWGIETLFGALKRRGFDLEATHLREGERLSRLLSVLALAFCWAYLCGAWLFEEKPWKEKKHGRLSVSLFRRGLDYLQRLLMPISGRNSQQQLSRATQFLSCT